MVQSTLLKRLCYVCLAGLFSSSAQAVENLNYLKPVPAIKTQKAAQYLLTDVDVIDKSVVVVGDRGHILVSQDNGASWTQADVPVQQLLTAVYFPSPQKGWAVGHEGVVLHSADGGNTWQLQFTNPYRNLSNDELDQLSDEEFTKLPQKGSPLLDVWFKDESTGFVVGAYGMFYSTTDGGKTWQDVSDRIDNYDGWHLNSIQANANGVVYIAGEKGVLFRSMDFGESWETLDAPYEGSFFNVLIGEGPNDVFIFGLQGNTFKSTDMGDTWQKVDSDTTDGLMGGVVLGKNKVMLVGNSGVIATSLNAGKRFKSKSTKQRKALLAVDRLPNGQLILVGQGGVRIESTELN